MRAFIVGTRNSKLALIQTNWVIAQLKNAGVQQPINIKEITTKGDRKLDVSLPKLGGGGVFLQEIEAELLKGTIDFAVHSLKDIPVQLPDRLKITAIPRREDYRDAYLAKNHVTFKNLPSGSVIGTSSLRRSAQLLAQRPDVQTKWIRGPIDSRIEQMQRGDYDAIILAVAGIKRLGIGTDIITEYLPAETFVPAIGQGALAIECRADDTELQQMLRLINDDPSERAVHTERFFMAHFDDGEQAPIGGYAYIENGEIVFNGTVISLDGKTILRYSSRGNHPERVAREAAAGLKEQGAMDIIRTVKRELEQ